ncbi:MAG TPA: SH3 domain-containing protein [Allosphingosinicella sp.]|jgi:hypothetical protein
MSLLCRLGLHRPRGVPRWNDGLYFATCGRCGRDLVRTAFQRWHVPRGYRVVWSTRPPASRPEVALVPEEIEPQSGPVESQATGGGPPPEPVSAHPEAPPTPSPSTQIEGRPPDAPAEAAAGEDPVPARPPVPAAESQGRRLPIQDVLAHLKAQDAAASPPPDAPAPRRRSTWDFMDDDPSEENAAPGLARGGASGREGAAGAAPRAGSGEAGMSPASRRGGAGERWLRVRSTVRNFFSGPGEPRPVLVTGLAMAVALGVALAIYLAGSQPSQRPASAEPGARGAGVETRQAPDPFAASSPHISAGDDGARAQPGVNGEAQGDRAYVSASLLVCREAPVRQAPRVRNFVRGKEVRVLGYDGDWASVAYRGGQCWARADFISPVPPLEG